MYVNILGHCVAALAVYLNHRFVFHGELGRLPILRKARKLHILHHLHAYDDVRNDYFEPVWVQLGFYFFVVLVGVLLSWTFAVGIVSFGFLYAYRHKNIHNKDKTSIFSVHHKYHHTVDPRCNFSGVYPSIDHMFKTSKEFKRLKSKDK